MGGNGEPVPSSTPHADGVFLMGQSVCAYSGQNDGFHDGSEPSRVQTYGTDKKLFEVPDFLHPGQACNPQKTIFQ